MVAFFTFAEDQICQLSSRLIKKTPYETGPSSGGDARQPLSISSMVISPTMLSM